MNYVYVVTKGYDYEGECVVGVFSTLEMARACNPGGDSQHIYRFQMDTQHYDEMAWVPGGNGKVS